MDFSGYSVGSAGWQEVHPNHVILLSFRTPRLTCCDNGMGHGVSHVNHEVVHELGIVQADRSCCCVVGLAHSLPSFSSGNAPDVTTIQRTLLQAQHSPGITRWPWAPFAVITMSVCTEKIRRGMVGTRCCHARVEDGCGCEAAMLQWPSCVYFFHVTRNMKPRACKTVIGTHRCGGQQTRVGPKRTRNCQQLQGSPHGTCWGLRGMRQEQATWCTALVPKRSWQA